MNDFLTVLNIHCIPLLLQVEDLSRMYRLFSKITRGLEPIGLFAGWFLSWFELAGVGLL